MNRPIKFRVWDKLNKKMIVDEDNLLISLSGDVVKVWDDGEWANTINGLNYILMQSTGLFDKNGKEIWEGDVVKSPGYDNQMVVKYEEIIASDDMTAPGIGFQFNTEPSGMEIIGNIYENPELIK